MTNGKSKVYLAIFTSGLLFFAAVIRSGVVVDRSFLPRFLTLSFFLFLTVIIGFRKRILLKRNIFACSLILFYFWNLLSTFWSIVPSEAIMQSQLVFLLLAVYLIIAAFNCEFREFENIFIKTLLFVLLFSFGLAFYRISLLDFFNPYRVLGVSANNNLYSGFLLLSMPLVLAGYSLNKGFWRYFSVLIGIMTLFFIVILQSRAAYIGLTIAIFVSLLFLVIRFRMLINKRNLVIGSVSVFILAVSVMIFYYSLDDPRRNYFLSKVAVWEYFRSYEGGVRGKPAGEEKKVATNTQIAAFDFTEDYHENANLRVIFWKKSLCLIKSHPLCGVGAGNWRINIPSCKEPENPEHTEKNFTYSQPHNEWIAIISELGIIGFILAIIIFFVPVAFVFYRLFFSASVHVSILFYASFIFGFYLFASFDFPLHRVEHNVLLFSIFAFMLEKVSFKRGRFSILGRIPKLKDGLASQFLPPKHKNTKMISLTTGLITLLLVFTVYLGIQRIMGEYFTVKMFSNERRNDDKVILYGQKAENPFYRITPNTLPVAWFEGVAYYRKGDFPSALNRFRDALKVTPWEVRVLNDYGASLYNLQDTVNAKSVLRNTIDIDPFFDDARFNLAAILYFEGKKDSALMQVENCRESQKKREFSEEMENGR
jgi:O-antigen ligase